MGDDRDEPATEGADDRADWAAYYRHTLGRDPRPLFVRGMEAVQAARMAPGQAIEVGFGDGTETLALLAAGWRVMAVDAAPPAAEILRSKVPPAAMDRLDIRTSSAEDVDLPPFDLLYAGYALPFLSSEAFARFWDAARGRARPGGLLVVNLFGTHDTWAGDPEMQFLGRDEVEALTADLEVVRLDEVEEDGQSFLGPKHWHVFDLVLRKPVGST